MNFSKVINCAKLYDLYEQIFDYFNLTIYDLESCIDTNLSIEKIKNKLETCLLYTSPSPRDATLSRMPSSA